MLHPVGNLPARVYWRRRLVFVGLPLIGLLLIVWALSSGGGDHPSAHDTASTTSKPSPTPTPTPPPTHDSASIGVITTTPKPTSAPSTSPAAAKDKGLCTAADVSVTAETDKKSFPVKSRPVLDMQVTNVSSEPCQLDVVGKHVEWRVYSGDVRVWGSNDCLIQPGSQVRTIPAQEAITLTIQWSGLTSAPKCAGTRIPVQAGTYKLYAFLDGKSSAAKTFTITK